jgi:hypothetical protein
LRRKLTLKVAPRALQVAIFPWDEGRGEGS